MTHPTAVLNVVGLNRTLLQHAPNLSALAQRGTLSTIEPTLPAVTTSVQSSFVTGRLPREHGIVANGWYHRDTAEIRFWHRSNNLVHGPRLWDTARQRDPQFTCANMFWWYNTHSSCDWIVNVRPIYKADGRKLPDAYAQPAALRDQLQQMHGTFPLFNFWGPLSSIASSRWIASATIDVHRQHRPTLTLVYLPHLDYDLQKLGPEHPDIPETVRAIDTEVGRLIDYFDSQNVRIIVLSEYGIEPVNGAIAINRVLREENALYIRDELGHELLEPGASEAFAVTDHQIAHMYVHDPANIERFASICRDIEGVEQVLDRNAQAQHGIDHERAGELVLIAAHDKWFTYDYWLDDHRAPDFARTIEIHRKPGFDPRELFIDPALPLPKWQLAKRIFRSKVLNLRTLMDVIPLDTSLVRGSHGRTDLNPQNQPVLISPASPDGPATLPAPAAHDAILSSLFDEPVRLNAQR